MYMAVTEFVEQKPDRKQKLTDIVMRKESSSIYIMVAIGNGNI